MNAFILAVFLASINSHFDDAQYAHQVQCASHLNRELFADCKH